MSEKKETKNEKLYSLTEKAVDNLANDLSVSLGVAIQNMKAIISYCEDKIDGLETSREVSLDYDEPL